MKTSTKLFLSVLTLFGSSLILLGAGVLTLYLSFGNHKETSEPYEPVVNESGFNSVGVEMIDKETKTDTVTVNDEVVATVNHQVWLYQLESENENFYVYAVVFEVSINPHDFLVTDLGYQIQSKDDLVLIDYDSSFFHQSSDWYEVTYKSNGSLVNGSVNVDEYHFSYYVDQSSKPDALEFEYNYYDRNQLEPSFSDYSKDDTMQKGLFLVTSPKPITNLLDTFYIVTSVDGKYGPTSVVAYDEFREEDSE